MTQIAKGAPYGNNNAASERANKLSAKAVRSTSRAEASGNTANAHQMNRLAEHSNFDASLAATAAGKASWIVVR